MKPWFEKEIQEADIIKFPEPERKVIKMPSVSEYPDFITGVQDLQARLKQGQIGQDSYDKLYQDLIQRFMKRESFESPWFLREAQPIGKSSDSSKPKYLKVVNDILMKDTPQNLKAIVNKKIYDITPDKIDKPITDMSQKINVTVNGEKKTMPVRAILKDPKIFPVTGAKNDSDSGPVSGRGDIAEGLLATAIFLRLEKDADIKDGDLLKAVSSLPPYAQPVTKTGKMKDASGKADNVKLTIYLQEKNYAQLKNTQILKSDKSLTGLVTSAVMFANAQEVELLDNFFFKNRKIDYVDVMASGAKDQKQSKIDVKVFYTDPNGKRQEIDFNFSVKIWGTERVGQESIITKKELAYLRSFDGGEIDEDLRKSMWGQQRAFFGDFGIDIEQKQYKKEKQMFFDVPEIEDMIEFSYNIAHQELQKKLQGDDNEKTALKNLIKGAKKHVIGDSPDAKLLNLGLGKRGKPDKDFDPGYYILEPKRLDRIVDKLDFTSTQPTEPGSLPKIKIVNKENPKDVFLEIRLKRGDRYTNYVDLGELFVKLTKRPTT
jgi:hypothetical protein